MSSSEAAAPAEPGWDVAGEAFQSPGPAEAPAEPASPDGVVAAAAAEGLFPGRGARRRRRGSFSPAALRGRKPREGAAAAGAQPWRWMISPG